MLQPLSLSPSRVIKIMFNQVSKENPFAVTENVVTPGNSNNVSGFDSDDSLDRGDDIFVDNSPGFSPPRYNGQASTINDWDKVINTTPAGRLLRE